MSRTWKSAVIHLLVQFLLISIIGCTYRDGSLSEFQLCNRHGKIVMGGILEYFHCNREKPGSLPPLVTYALDGRPMHSWRALILPYTTTGSGYRFSEPWDGEHNVKLLQYSPDIFTCLTNRPPPASGYTDVFALVGEGTLWGEGCNSLAELEKNSHRPLIIIVEGSKVPWSMPFDIDLSNIRPDGTIKGMEGARIRYAFETHEIFGKMIEFKEGDDVAKLLSKMPSRDIKESEQ